MWKKIIAIILIIITGVVIYDAVLPRGYIKDCKGYYRDMSKPEYLAKLRDYCSFILHDPIDGLNYIQLITWEHQYLEYIPIIVGDFPRRNMPIDILDQTVQANGKAMGRCHEFALLYTGLCMANGIKVKLIIDESYLFNESKSAAGDHVWNEIWDERWIHIDPTESRIDDPKMYVRDWNKDVNLVYAISFEGENGKEIVQDVTNKYA